MASPRRFPHHPDAQQWDRPKSRYLTYRKISRLDVGIYCGRAGPMAVLPTGEEPRSTIPTAPLARLRHRIFGRDPREHRALYSRDVLRDALQHDRVAEQVLVGFDGAARAQQFAERFDALS